MLAHSSVHGQSNDTRLRLNWLEIYLVYDGKIIKYNSISFKRLARGLFNNEELTLLSNNCSHTS